METTYKWFKSSESKLIVKVRYSMKPRIQRKISDYCRLSEGPKNYPFITIADMSECIDAKSRGDGRVADIRSHSCGNFCSSGKRSCICQEKRNFQINGVIFLNQNHQVGDLRAKAQQLVKVRKVARMDSYPARVIQVAICASIL